MGGYEIYLATAGLIISLSGSGVYIASILRGKTRPHLFTHLVWGIVTAIAFVAQVMEHGGPGAWIIGVTALSCLTNALLALRYGEQNITRMDKASLAVAVLAIIIWVLTKAPLPSVILASVIDIVAFFPTFRKSWMKPWEENLTAYNIANVKLALSIAALTHVTLTTALYPVAGFAVNAAFVVTCLLRRRLLSLKEPRTNTSAAA